MKFFEKDIEKLKEMYRAKYSVYLLAILAVIIILVAFVVFYNKYGN